MHARAYIVAAEVYVEWVVTMSVHIMGHVPLWEGLAWKSYLFDKKICAVACNCARMACKSCNCKVLVQVAVYLLSLCPSRSAGSVDIVCYLCHVELCLFGFCCSASWLVCNI